VLSNQGAILGSMFDEHRNRSACVYETRPRNTHHRKACCVGEYGNWCVEVAEFVSHLFSSSTKDPSRAPSFESHVKEQGHTGNVGLSTTVYVGFRPPYTSCVGAGHYHTHRPDWRTRRTPSNDMGQGGQTNLVGCGDTVGVDDMHGVGV